MRVTSLLLMLLVVALLGSVILPRYVASEIRPDVFAIALIFLATGAPREDVLPLCWIIGLMRDLMTGGPLGAYALLYLISGAVLLRIRTISDARVSLTRGLLGFAVSLATDSAHVMAGGGLALAWHSVGALVRVALVTGILTPIVLWVLSRLGKRLGIRRGYVFGTS